MDLYMNIAFLTKGKTKTSEGQSETIDFWTEYAKAQVKKHYEN